MMAKSPVYLLLFSLITPWLYDRYQTFLPLLANRPGKFTAMNNLKSFDVKFRNDLRNCEDAVLDEEKGIAFLSCDEGRDEWNTVMGHFYPGPDLKNGVLWTYEYASADKVLHPLVLKNFPNANDFHPLGIEWDLQTSKLYVVNHAHSASYIESFTINLSDYTATHIKTFQHPLLPAPNSIHSLGNNRLFVTNDHYFYARWSRILAQVETWVGLPMASVVFLDLNDASPSSSNQGVYVPTTAKTVARLPFANGIAMLNTTTLAVASTTKPGVYFYSVSPSYTLKNTGFIRTPAAVDNLSIEKSTGKLLIAGHPFAPTLVALAGRRPSCDLGSESESERKACECDAPSWAAEWSEEEGLREVYKGDKICSSTTVVRDGERGVGIMVGLYDRGVMVFEA